jgi:DNA polymerase-1
MPDDLRTQIDMIHSLISTLGIPVYSQSGYEADDIIGTLAVLQKTQLADTQVVIISSDKDLCQFVHDGHVHIYDAMKQKFLREKEVHEKFGVPTTQVCDYLAIVGDTSDNIPGIAGFGPKKAGDLLSTYESLAGIYKSI